MPSTSPAAGLERNLRRIPLGLGVLVFSALVSIGVIVWGVNGSTAATRTRVEVAEAQFATVTPRHAERDNPSVRHSVEGNDRFIVGTRRGRARERRRCHDSDCERKRRVHRWPAFGGGARGSILPSSATPTTTLQIAATTSPPVAPTTPPPAIGTTTTTPSGTSTSAPTTTVPTVPTTTLPPATTTTQPPITTPTTVPSAATPSTTESSKTRVITGIAGVGTVLKPGDTAFSIDGRPTVVVPGAVPAWRAVDSDTERWSRRHPTRDLSGECRIRRGRRSRRR